MEASADLMMFRPVRRDSLISSLTRNVSLERSAKELYTVNQSICRSLTPKFLKPKIPIKIELKASINVGQLRIKMANKSMIVDKEPNVNSIPDFKAQLRSSLMFRKLQQKPLPDHDKLFVPLNEDKSRESYPTSISAKYEEMIFPSSCYMVSPTLKSKYAKPPHEVQSSSKLYSVQGCNRGSKNPFKIKKIITLEDFKKSEGRGASSSLTPKSILKKRAVQIDETNKDSIPSTSILASSKKPGVKFSRQIVYYRFNRD